MSSAAASCRRRFADHLDELRNSRPVAVIVEEPPALSRFQIFRRIGTGLAHVALDTGADRIDPILEEARQIDRPVTTKVGHLLGRRVPHCILTR